MSTAAEEPTGLWARIRHNLSIPGQLIHIVLRDPHHVPERLTVYAVDHHTDAVRAWAEKIRTNGDGDRAAVAESQYRRTISTARIDGAISGTPFFIALVPAYIGFLQQEMRFHLRIAALYGRDPADPDLAATFLVLRGIHKDNESALAELAHVRATPLPEKGERTPLRSWYHAIMRVLVLAGFIGPPEDDPKKRTLWDTVVDTIKFVVTCLVWALTWILPLTFMILMAWSCENDARRFGQRVLDFFREPGEDVDTTIARADRKAGGNRVVNVMRAALVFLSVALPMALIIGTIGKGKGPLGIPVSAEVGALAAVALVIGVTVAAVRG